MHIESLQLSAPELPALEGFYGGVLGLSIRRADDALEIAAGATRLTFREDPGIDGAYHFAFNIPENRLAAAITWLQSLGIELLPNGDAPIHDFADWNSQSVYFLDPTGNILEFIARHELDNAAQISELFSPRELLNVSEIGIACEDILQTADQIAAKYGLDFYRDPSDQFAAVGNANGLLILVPVGRVWYPNTGILAQKLPLMATFSAAGQPRHLAI